MSVRAFTLVACMLFAGAALAADKPGPNDWPQWRGQNRDGKSPEKGLLKTWPKDGPAKGWTGKDLGTGFSSPAIAAGKVFGMGSRNGKDGVFALNESDGKELWFTPIDDTRISKPNYGPGSTPTYADGKVYAVSNKNGVVAKLDATTGKIEWQKSYADYKPGQPSWGFCDSVLVDGDSVICVPSSNKVAVAALKVADGEVKWSVAAGNIGGGAGYCSPVKTTVGGIPMYVVTLGNESGAVGVHAETGALLWQYKNKNVFGSVAQIPTPIVFEDRVFISTAYNGGTAALQLIPQGKDKVEVKEIWSSKEDPKNHHGNMILIDGKVYFGHGQNNGIPVCYDLKTGEEVWHAKATPQGASGSAAYTYADGMLYIRYQNRLMTLVKPSPKQEDHKIVSQFMLPEPNDKGSPQSWAHPVIANGKMYIRDHNVLYTYKILAATN